MRNRLNDKNFWHFNDRNNYFHKVDFLSKHITLTLMILTLKYVTVFAGVFFHKSETSNDKEVYTMLSTRVKLL